MSKKQKTGTIVDITNRDVWEAFDALQALVTKGWGDAGTALNLGRTNRRLRDKRDEIDDARQLLLGKYGKIKPDGGVEMTNQLGFSEEWRKLLAASTQLEVFPVSLTSVSSRIAECEKCKRGPLADISAGALEVLVHVGIIREDGSAA